MATETKPKAPPPKPGSTAHTIARSFVGPERVGVPAKIVADATAKLSEAIQVGIDYEVGKARLELTDRLLRYRKALERVEQESDERNLGLGHIVEDALKD